MVALILLGCAPRLTVPDLAGTAEAPRWPPAPDPARVVWVGELQPAGAHFGRPIDVACGVGHRIAVADADAGRVWVLDLATRRSWSPVADPPLATPVGVSFDGLGALFVVDARRAAVLHGSSERGGRLVPAIPDGQLSRPTAALSRPDGTVLVVDAGAHTVARMTPEGGVEPVWATHAGAGEGLNFPVDAAVGADGALYVADAMNAAVERISPDGTLSLFVGGEARKGTLVRPKGVAVDATGRVHVVDGAMQHVEVYTADGQLVGRYGEPGSGPGQLGLPAGICIDSDAHVFIADSLNGRVQIYRLLEGG